MNRFGSIVGLLLIAGGYVVNKPEITAFGAFVLGINLIASGDVDL